jgi:hypothetical protein
MEYSTKIDHDDVTISHGNTTIDQTGKYHSLFVFLVLKNHVDKFLKYYINIENEDIFDIFKKPEKFSLCLRTLNSNAAKKKRKSRRIKKKKKTITNMKLIPSDTSVSGFIQLEHMR